MYILLFDKGWKLGYKEHTKVSFWVWLFFINQLNNNPQPFINVSLFSFFPNL